MGFIKLDPAKHAEGMERIQAELDALDTRLAASPTDDLREHRRQTAAYLDGLRGFPVHNGDGDDNGL